MPALCIIPARALQDPEMTGVRLTALCAIGKFTSRDGRGVWAANSTIADAAHLDERVFRRAAAWLVERGYVRKQHRFRDDGSQSTNMLAIVLDDPEDVADVAEGGRVESSHPPGGLNRPTPPGRIDPPPRGESSLLPRAESTHPGRVESPHQTSPVNATASPPPAIASTLEAEFAHEPHRTAYLALRASHRLPASLDAGLRDVHDPINGGPAFAWDVIGAGLLQLQANGETFNVSRLRGYCRSHLAGAPPSGRRGSGAPQIAGPADAVRVGPQLLSAVGVWQACVDVGLTSPMLSRETVEELVGRLVERGAVQDRAAFVSLVLAIDPPSLAAITFAKTREERLRERLATWAAQAPGRAA
jgi:hypothetical protein